MCTKKNTRETSRATSQKTTLFFDKHRHEVSSFRPGESNTHLLAYWISFDCEFMAQSALVKASFISFVLKDMTLCLRNLAKACVAFMCVHLCPFLSLIELFRSFIF